MARQRVAIGELQKCSADKNQVDLGQGLHLVRSTAPARESDAFNETSVEMSIREVKKIKKLGSKLHRRHIY